MHRTVCLRTLVATLIVLLGRAPAARAQSVLVLPYVQPGDGRTLTGSDVKVIHWLTDQKPGRFVVEVYLPDGSVRTIEPERVTLDFGLPKPPPKKRSSKPASVKLKPQDTKKTKKTEPEPRMPLPPEAEQHYYKYSAHVRDLPFNAAIRYRVKLGDGLIREATFRTRATADRTVRCVLVGDLAQGRYVQRAIAFEISRQQPDFLIALGDIVYPTGRVRHYMGYFWGTYNNVDRPGAGTGAPLMATIPFYAVLGNHDIGARPAWTPDALAAYYFFSPPKGGPGEGPWTTRPGDPGDDAVAIARFRALARDSYPNLDAYSFDYGPAHFVVLNNNSNMQITARAFLDWLRADLKNTRARWKFVCFHVPGFHSSKQHYGEQQARLLQPLFEECGVTMTFAGHVHNYQRTVPLRFAPSPGPRKDRLVNGEFALDTGFDGVCNTRPGGVMHIVAGGGGASLYGPGLDETGPYLRETFASNYGGFTARLVADRHSFVVLDIAPERLRVRAMGADGARLDEFVVTR